jgi:hypothetical protein
LQRDKTLCNALPHGSRSSYRLGCLVLRRLVLSVPLPSFRFLGVLVQRQFHGIVDQHKGKALVVGVMKRDMVEDKVELVDDVGLIVAPGPSP